MQYMQKIPVSSMLPAFMLNFGALLSEKIVFAGNFVEYGLSPVSLNLITKRVNDKLKEIETQFENDNNDDAFQLIIDENFVNTVFASVATVDKMYSLREVMSKDPRFAMFKTLLTTTSIGMILPSFKDDYGDGKAIDLVGTLSHDFF